MPAVFGRTQRRSRQTWTGVILSVCCACLCGTHEGTSANGALAAPPRIRPAPCRPSRGHFLRSLDPDQGEPPAPEDHSGIRKKSFWSRIFAALGIFMWWASSAPAPAKAEEVATAVSAVAATVDLDPALGIATTGAAPVATQSFVGMASNSLDARTPLADTLAEEGEWERHERNLAAGLVAPELPATDAAAVEEKTLVELDDGGLAAATGAHDLATPAADTVSGMVQQKQYDAKAAAAVVAPDLKAAQEVAVVEAAAVGAACAAAVKPQPAEEEAERAEAEAEPEEAEDMPKPVVPGMEDANLVVGAAIDPKLSPAKASGSVGVAALMSCTHGEILGKMAQDGWEVTPLDLTKSLFELKLPAVKYELPVGAVSIPSPTFNAVVRDSTFKDGDYKERLVGDLILQNGDDILTVELRWVGTFKISAAGFARAFVGQEGDSVRMRVDVELGLKVPRVPGLTPIMEYFVKNYGSQSTQDCANGLAKSADQLSSK